MTPLAETERLVEIHFKRDSDKIVLWWRNPNPLLGGISPNMMIELRKDKRLLKVVREWVDSNPV